MIQRLFVIGLLAAFLLPIAINQLVNVDTSAWDPTLVTIWDNIPIIILVAVLIGLITLFVTRGTRRGGL